MTTETSDYGHFVSVEDAQTGEVFHFVVGMTKSMRYIGGRDPSTGNTPSQSSKAYASAEAAAVDYFKLQAIL